MSRILWMLAQYPAIQDRLRLELTSARSTASNDDLDYETLMSLPYLDAVVREILRVHAPVRATGRIAAKDDIIPLSIPITDRYGRTHDHVKYVPGAASNAIL